MKFLLVGGRGSIAGKHLDNIRIIDPSIEVDICDPAGGDYKTIEEIEDINIKYDLVLGCLPTEQHLYLLHYCNDHLVKNLFLEKPLCSLPTDYQLWQQAGLPPFVRELKTNVCIGYAYKFERGILKLKELLPMLGEIKHVSFENSYHFKKLHPQYDHDKWDGILWDDVHTINLSRWMFGDPEQILSKHVERDFAQWNWKTKDGIIVSHMTDALNQRYKKRIEVRGEEGTLTWNWKAHEVFFAPKNEDERIAIPYKHANHLYEEMRWVIDKVKKGEPFDMNTTYEAVKDMELLEELLK